MLRFRCPASELHLCVTQTILPNRAIFKRFPQKQVFRGCVGKRHGCPSPTPRRDSSDFRALALPLSRRYPCPSACPPAPRAASQSPSSSPLVSSGSGGLFVFWVSSGTYLKGGAGWRLRLVNVLGERIHRCNLFNFAPQELFLGLKRRDGLGKSESFEGLSGRESEAVYEESGLNISRMMQHFVSSCREH